jgi:hypothetical protein
MGVEPWREEIQSSAFPSFAAIMQQSTEDWTHNKHVLEKFTLYYKPVEMRLTRIMFKKPSSVARRI